MISAYLIGILVGSVGTFLLMKRGEKNRIPYRWVCPHDCGFTAASNDVALLDRVIRNHMRDGD